MKNGLQDVSSEISALSFTKILNLKDITSDFPLQSTSATAKLPSGMRPNAFYKPG